MVFVIDGDIRHLKMTHHSLAGPVPSPAWSGTRADADATDATRRAEKTLAMMNLCVRDKKVEDVSVVFGKGAASECSVAMVTGFRGTCRLSVLWRGGGWLSVPKCAEFIA
jgi:hypothetical protein